MNRLLSKSAIYMQKQRVKTSKLCSVRAAKVIIKSYILNNLIVHMKYSKIRSLAVMVFEFTTFIQTDDRDAIILKR